MYVSLSIQTSKIMASGAFKKLSSIISGITAAKLSVTLIDSSITRMRVKATIYGFLFEPILSTTKPPKKLPIKAEQVAKEVIIPIWAASYPLCINMEEMKPPENMTAKKK